MARRTRLTVVACTQNADTPLIGVSESRVRVQFDIVNGSVQIFGQVQTAANQGIVLTSSKAPLIWDERDVGKEFVCQDWHAWTAGAGVVIGITETIEAGDEST